MHTGELIMMWYKLGKHKYKPTTQKHMRYTIDADIVPALGAYDIRDVTPLILQDYIDNIAMAKTIDDNAKILRQFFAWVCREGYITENPIEKIRFPRSHKPYKISIFSKSEIQELIACEPRQWMADLIDVAYRQSLRRGEVLGIMPQDVHLRDRLVIINREKVGYAKDKIAEYKPKTKQSVRVVMLDDHAITVLQRRLAIARRHKSKYVFCRDDGGEIIPGNIPYFFRRSCKYAGIDYRPFRCLRHSLVCNALMDNVPAEALRDRLGHRHLETTLQCYGRYIIGGQQHVVDYLNREDEKYGRKESPNEQQEVRNMRHSIIWRAAKILWGLCGKSSKRKKDRSS